jgi:glyoxylase-like metal-dependent hydrolase (beta-lactamase superfamily II)
MRQIAPGLHYWTAAHPNFDPVPEPESPADWPEQVGCVLFEGPDAVVLIDPLVPEERWGELDERIADRPVVVLTTLRFHGRSRDAVLERYDGTRVRHDAPMPAGVEALPVTGFDETMYWLPGPRALVPGDRLIGDGAGAARMCPPSWLDYIPSDDGVEELRVALSPLLELPVEHLLLSHGDPVVGGGAAALARALAA